MTIHIGPIELKVNAFLVILAGLAALAHNLGTNEKLMNDLREKAAVSKAKKEQAEAKARSLFPNTNDGVSMGGDNADEIIAQLFPNLSKMGGKKKNA